MADYNGELQIIRADLNDETQMQHIVMLINHYAQEPHVKGSALANEVLDALADGLRSHPTSHVWLAYDGEQAVGVAVCFLGYSTFTAKPLMNVHDLAVHADARGRGAGTSLLTTVEIAAREMGCSYVTLEVDDGNPRARELYQRVGFQLGEEGISAQRFMKKSL